MPIANEMTVEEYKKEAKRLEREHWNIVFAKQLDIEVWVYEKEYKFHPTRRWKFDYVIWQPGIDKDFISREWQIAHGWIIAVELEGGTYTRGRHVRGAGFAKDSEKYNAATAMGWKVFRFPSEMIKDGSAIKFLREEVW